MEINISYGINGGPGDGSDLFEYGGVELDESMTNMVMFDILLNEYEDIVYYPELQEFFQKITKEIEESEIEDYLQLEDEYVMECLGKNKVATDTLNILVHNKDPHALEFFHLEKSSDAEISTWDANALSKNDLPTVKEFNPDFHPINPFEDGWGLSLYANDADYTEEELRSYLVKLFDNKEYEDLQYIADFGDTDLDLSLEEFIENVAKELDCQEYFDFRKSE